jgi:transcriptional regulator with XRE-family HTH domain
MTIPEVDDPFFSANGLSSTICLDKATVKGATSQAAPLIWPSTRAATSCAEPEAGVTDVNVEPNEAGQTFASRLDHLFRRVHPSDKPEFTYEEVANGVTQAGHDISAAYVWQLRNGKRTNPTLRHIEGLAAFFGVPASYFLDPAVQRQVDAELDLITSLRDAGVQNLALRAHGLSPEGLAAVESMVEHVRRLEKLSDPETSMGDGGPNSE